MFEISNIQTGLWIHKTGLWIHKTGALRLDAPVQGGLCHEALAVLYVPIQVDLVEFNMFNRPKTKKGLKKEFKTGGIKFFGPKMAFAIARAI
jgi:hypothetical protein